MTSSTTRENRLTLAAALGGAVMISFSAIYFGLSESTPTTAAFFRAAYALPVLIVIWLFRRGSYRRPPRFRWIAVGAGLTLGVGAVAWHTSIEYIGAGLATLIANTSVVFVAIAAWVLLGERPRRATLITIPFILVGVTLVSGMGRGDSFGADPIRGTLFALVAAVTYAIFFLGIRQANDGVSPTAGLLAEATVGTLIATLLIAAFGGDLDLTVSFPSHAWLLALALGSQVVGWLLIAFALPRLPAAEVATIMLVQPAMTMLWAAMIFDERPSALQITGAAMVLAGVGYVALVRAQRAEVPLPEPVSATQHHDQ